MKLLPRTTTANPEVVRLNKGKPYSTGYYDTHIKRIDCCGVDPDLFGGTKIQGFLWMGVYEFRCPICKKVGIQENSWNGAAAGWNEALTNQ